MKIVFATDVRYWRRETGAHQRIFELVRYLSGEGYSVTTVFLAPLDNGDGQDDKARIELSNLTVVSLIDDWRPVSWFENFHWQWRCVINALSKIVFAKPAEDGTVTATRSLADFRSAELKLRFRNWVRQDQPDVVIVEYVTLAYLVPDRGRRGGVKYAVDTHDYLSRRCEKFREHGFVHWVEITPAEEGAALKRFDIVIAIEPQEADAFRGLVGDDASVVIAGHPAEVQPIQLRTGSLSEPIVIGCLASGNFANSHAIHWFFDHVWPHLLAATKGKNISIEFQLAGSITKFFANQQRPANVELIGVVEGVSDFYRTVDIVVNPVQFGTGLKIKNLEALAFGRPLVTTTHGNGGSQGLDVPWLVAASADEMVAHLLKLISNEDLRQQLSTGAVRFVAEELSPEKVYSPLVKALSLDKVT